MSILSKLSSFGAALALSTSLMAAPAIADTISGQASFHNASGDKHYRGRRGNNFRGHRGRNFRGNRGRNFRGHRGRNFRGNRHARRNFNRGYNRGFNDRRRFDRRRFRNNNFGHNGFRGNDFRRSGFNSGHQNNVVHHPSYSIGGFYGSHSNTIIINDFGGHGLYAPPRGYQWVCDKGSSDAILAAIATGAIIAIAADVLTTPY